MKLLIVNADDFGLTKGVSHGIIAAHTHGIITSTSLMANGSAFEESITLARKHRNLGIGAHLNLTQGTPVAPLSEVQSLVNPEGRLCLSSYRLWAGMLTRKIRISEMETELRAQIDKIISAGISPTHLDGHKHVHILPGISELVIRLAQEFGIPAIRTPLDELPSLDQLLKTNPLASLSIFKQVLVSRGPRLLALRLKHKALRGRLRCPARFYGLSQTGFLDLWTLQSILRSLPEGTSELMCHPGYCDPALKDARTRLLAEREKELEALTSIEIKKLVKYQQIQLATYRDLTAIAEAA
jgi:hopanoid biosynthesis associated protein HpnK